MNIRLLALFSVLLIWGCSEDGNEAPPPEVNFTTQQAAISADNESTELRLVFSRAVSSGGQVVVNWQSDGLVYGEENDFYTVPASDATNAVALEYAAGEEAVSFEVRKGNGLNIQEDLEVTFSISDPEGFIAGTQNSVEVIFGENFIAESGLIAFDAGGADFDFINYVYLSKNQLTSVDKKTWDLGFYNGDGYNVILNSAAYVMARPLDKTDLTSVSAADTAGFGFQMVIPQFDPTLGASAWVDSPDGDLSKTAIGDISATSDDSPVFIIKRDGENRNWKKVKVFQSGDAYEIQFADIDSEDISSTTIDKSTAHNFVHFDLDNGVVSSEPEKEFWDIQYGSFTELFPFGGPGVTIPYGFKDFITINRYNTEAALVMEEDLAYENINLSDMETITFDSVIDVIGENWRQGGGPNAQPSLLDDRYFILKDSEGNYYKLRFTQLTSSTGERGKAEFQYKLISILRKHLLLTPIMNFMRITSREVLNTCFPWRRLKTKLHCSIFWSLEIQ
jgi:hypothetical protein